MEKLGHIFHHLQLDDNTPVLWSRYAYIWSLDLFHPEYPSFKANIWQNKVRCYGNAMKLN